MPAITEDLRYTKSHEWVRQESDGTYTVGITDHAQSELGDLVFVELPEVDAEINAGDEVCVVESVKTAADVFSPISGKVVEVNDALEDNPAKVNHDPYGDGWLFRIKPDDLSEIDELLDEDQYQEELAEEE